MIGRDVLGDAWAQSRWKDKKGELADQLDRAFAAPDKDGRAPEQAEKLKSWLPAGMAFGGIAGIQQAADADEDREAA
jgi:ParB family chromosome partitioning protein